MTTTNRRCAPIARIVPISFTRWRVAMTMALLMTTSAIAKKMTTAASSTARSSVTRLPTIPEACCQSTTFSPSPARSLASRTSRIVRRIAGVLASSSTSAAFSATP